MHKLLEIYLFDPEDENLLPLYYDLHGPDRNVNNNGSTESWVWNYDEHWYYNEYGEKTLYPEDMDETSIEFLDLYIMFFLNISNAMILNEATIQQWYSQSRGYIQDGTLAQYLFGSGGKNTISPFDIKAMKKKVGNQWLFLKKFTEEIVNGELSGAQIMSRIRMYGESTTYGYEEAKAKSHNVVMPEYPADGSQQCHSNCRCRWMLEDDPNSETHVLGTWKINPLAEHCDDCVENARNWDPIRVEKGFLEDEDDDDNTGFLEDEDDNSELRET